MPTCSRCAASTPTAASAEVCVGRSRVLHTLCAWCAQVLAAALAPIDNAGDVDDLNNDLVHAPNCLCDECDPDFHRELARDNAA